MSNLDSTELPFRSSSSDDGGRQSRYVFKHLTPHKILILIVIHSYCIASVPAKYQAEIFRFLLREIEVNHSIIDVLTL